MSLNQQALEKILSCCKRVRRACELLLLVGPPTAAPWPREPVYCGCQQGPNGVSPWPERHDDRAPAPLLCLMCAQCVGSCVGTMGNIHRHPLGRASQETVSLRHVHCSIVSRAVSVAASTSFIVSSPRASWKASLDNGHLGHCLMFRAGPAHPRHRFRSSASRPSPNVWLALHSCFGPYTSVAAAQLPSRLRRGCRRFARVPSQNPLPFNQLHCASLTWEPRASVWGCRAACSRPSLSSTTSSRPPAS